MEQLLNKIIGQIATLIEMGAAVFITMGALETFYQLFILTRFNIIQHPSGKREVWLQFATWLVLALEFELAADVLRTTVAPSWNVWDNLRPLHSFEHSSIFF
jgi:uncharacterized membrane protein